YGTPDNRSYKVSFRKAREVLDYEAKFTPVDAVKEIESALAEGRLTSESKWITLDWYKHLLTDEQASKEVALRGIVL
ncbi:MAG: NAD-dependent epimerase/dehydratase family protein, partial [Nitrososphaerales archaeon]